MQLVEEKENSEFKPVKLRLEIDLVSYPARAEGLVNIYKHYQQDDEWARWIPVDVPDNVDVSFLGGVNNSY